MAGKDSTMKIGILGGTGPAGSALAARLADAGYPVVVGSRSKYRAMEKVDELLEQWPGRDLPIEAGDNATAARADVVVLTGGASVGAHDVARDVLTEQAGAAYRHVRIQPGKPQGWARWQGTPVVSLPGNPVSAAISSGVGLPLVTENSTGAATPSCAVSARACCPVLTVGCSRASWADCDRACLAGPRAPR